MPSKADKVLKAIQDGKRVRALKEKSRGGALGEHSGSAGSPLVITEGGTPKRARRSATAREDPPTVGSERGFEVRPCFGEGQFFDNFLLSVSSDEVRRLRDERPSAF